MELLLNLTWLLVAAMCAIGLLRRARREPNSANIWLFAAAMLCIVVLLFPVISMTDDLHAEVFTAEESGKRRVVAIQIEHQLSNLQSLATRLAISMFTFRRPTWSPAADPFIPSPLDGTRAAYFTRPPPSLFLA